MISTASPVEPRPEGERAALSKPAAPEIRIF
jgi:hypothetical protein